MTLTAEQVLGVGQQHLAEINDALNGTYLVHKAIIPDLTRLLSQAQKDGQAIAIVSSYRDFERQLTLWNDKWLGHRPVYSRHGRPLNISLLSEMEKYKAIALWSALPGMSRHHWGTDLDIFSAHAISDGYRVQLQPSEFEPGGAAYTLNQWLNENLEKFGFFRPYREYQNGVSIEPWHISHIAYSQKAMNSFSFENCVKTIESSGIQSKPFIIDKLNHYYRHYFNNICSPS